MPLTNPEILHHFYSLLLDMNFKQDESEPPTAEELADPFLQKHLRQFKLRIAKGRASLKKSGYRSILKEIERLREMGAEELSKFLTPLESRRLQPLFSKFESLSEKDRESIEEDQELLQLLSALKDKLEKQDEDE